MTILAVQTDYQTPGPMLALVAREQTKQELVWNKCGLYYAMG